MDPIKICDFLLSKIKNSNLNFALSETPFAVSICIKKSFIRDKNGSPKYPASNFSESQTFLSEEIKSLKTTIAQYEIDQEASNQAIHDLDLKLQKAKVEIGDILLQRNQLKQANDMKLDEVADLTFRSNTLKLEAERLKKEYDSFQKLLKTKDREINNLKMKNENMSENLAKTKEEKVILLEEKNQIVKEKKLQIKLSKINSKTNSKYTNTLSTSSSDVSTNTLSTSRSNVSTNTFCTSSSDVSTNTPTISTNTIRPDASTDIPPTSQLGQDFATSPPIAATTSYSSSDLATTSSYSSSDLATTSSNSSSSLATTSVKNYTTLQENTPFNSTVCLHTVQCVARQPRPPPPEKCTILVNHRSKYHEHMVSKDGVPSRYGTHDYCMRIDHNNYGCEECVWYKWWGELHGYPDTSPWRYQKHVDPSKWPELGLW